MITGGITWAGRTLRVSRPGTRVRRHGLAGTPRATSLVRLALGVVVLAPTLLVAQPQLIDAFDSVDAWRAVPSEGATAALALADGETGRALAMEFELTRTYSYAIARCDLATPLELPEDFRFTFDLRAETAVNNFEFKLIDEHDNVWWQRRLDFAYPRDWTRQSIRRRHLTLAWGPQPQAPLRRVKSIELVISAGNGGRGRLLVDNLRFEGFDARAAAEAQARVSVSSAAPGGEPACDRTGNLTKPWRFALAAAAPQLTLDFGTSREIGGVMLEWAAGAFAAAYDVQLSDDGAAWTTVGTVTAGNGGRDWLYLPDQQGRGLRLVLGAGVGEGTTLTRLEVRGAEMGAGETAFFSAVAAEARRGTFPRYFSREQTYWTIVGSPGDVSEALLNEDGAIEVDQLGFTLEPFLWIDGQLVTWAEVERTSSLENGYLPIPSVTWRRGDLALTITALAAGAAGPESRLIASYQLVAGGRPARGTLFVAVRPFQVNPPWQSLQKPAGWARVNHIAYAGGVLAVDDRVVVPLDAPSAVGASAFEGGEIVEHLRAGAMPRATEVRDARGFASGALAYDFDLAAGRATAFRVVVPFHDRAAAPAPNQPRGDVDAYVSAAHAETRRTWESMLDRFHVRLPAAAQPVIHTIQSNLAYIFINQDGPRIQPGSRNYERSWIRDGSLTSTAMLELGLFDEVRAYCDWYAQFQFPNGWVPCVVDNRGGDPTAEHDSHGQMIFLIRQVHHFTDDDAWLRGKWPVVEKTVRLIQSLRAQRKTELYRTGTPEQRACYGLVPESISHEGYSAKAMHSYWDDFFILRGLKDATEIAEILGETDAAREFAAERDDFTECLYASMRLAMQNTGIDFIPGCVELGDFDATSTTVGLSPANELGRIPEPQLHRTFEKYYERFVQRRDGAIDWLDYTPYENRVLGSFVLLGQRARAHEILDWFMAQRRPAGWNHWAEVVFRDERLPRTIGDMPHSWCGSDFIRSVRLMFVYEREQHAALVLGAGLAEAWVLDPAGIDVSRLPTYHGPIDYTVRSREGGRVVDVTVAGPVKIPRGGLLFTSPLDRPIVAVSGDARLVAPGADEIRIEKLPATFSVRY